VHTGKKSFNGKPITVIISKTANKCKADLHSQATQECRRKDRAVAIQAHQQQQANHCTDNAITIVAYNQQVAQATTSFTGLL
jgi:hypothetical protein